MWNSLKGPNKHIMPQWKEILEKVVKKLVKLRLPVSSKTHREPETIVTLLAY